MDHLVIAAPDLDAAKDHFEKRSGVRPVDGGAHTGLGTRNALVSFGDGHYLEIIAPDPEQKLDGTMGARLAAMPDELVLHWAVRSDDLARVAGRARASGLVPSEIRRTRRERPEGGTLEWELMGIGGHELGGFMPFFIDWLNCPHPADTTPVVGALERFELSLPEASPAHALLRGAPGVELRTGLPRLRVAYGSPQGRIELEADRMSGFGF